MRRVAAFFDMDRTLLACNSGERWVRFLRRRREISLYRTLRAVGWLLEYRMGVLDFARISERVVAAMHGDEEAAMWEKCTEFLQELLPTITPAARAAVAHHRAEGHVLAILSSSTPYVTEQLARELDIPHVLCTRLHVEAGRFTGRVHRPVCFGRGKIYWAERFAAEQAIDLGQSFFYSDSYTDLPMLARAGKPVVVNPDPRLLRHARRTGWPIERW